MFWYNQLEVLNSRHFPIFSSFKTATLIFCIKPSVDRIEPLNVVYSSKYYLYDVKVDSLIVIK